MKLEAIACSASLRVDEIEKAHTVDFSETVLWNCVKNAARLGEIRL